MALVRGSIELLSSCLEPYQMISKTSGHIILALWFMPITVHAQMPWVSVLTTFFTVDNLCSPLILSMVSLLQNCLKLLLINMFKKSRLEHAFNKANEFCEKEASRTKERFDKTAKCSKLLPGDLVLVKRKGFTSKHKSADKWETEPYEIVFQCSDGLPVYTVMRNDRERTLHRNMLFLLALQRDSGRILPNLAEFENTENPELNQVDNFSNNDGEVDQPVYEGPQTRSHTRKLMKANCLMADLFDIETVEICDDVSDVVVTVSKVNDKSIRFSFGILVQTGLHILLCLS